MDGTAGPPFVSITSVTRQQAFQLASDSNVALCEDIILRVAPEAPYIGVWQEEWGWPRWKRAYVNLRRRIHDWFDPPATDGPEPPSSTMFRYVT